MHVGVHVYLEGPHGQCYVGSRCGRVDVVVEGLPLEVWRQHGLHELAARHCRHRLVHRELQLPRAGLARGVDTREPQAAAVLVTVGEEVGGPGRGKK